MAIAAATFVVEVVKVCYKPIKRQFNYLADYNENMENLNTSIQNLETNRAEVEREVLFATDKGENIMPHVQEWWREVEGKKKEGEEILQAKDSIGNGCGERWFKNVKLRYSLSKKAIKKSADLDQFVVKRGKFKTVAEAERSLAYVPDPRVMKVEGNEESKEGTTSKMPVAGADVCDPGVLKIEGNEESKEGTTSKMPVAGADGGLTSRLKFIEEVMVAVRNPNIRIISICGMGGIGKSTIAKEVERKARDEFLFQEIAMVEVSQNPDPKVLQRHIADFFELELKEDYIPARATRLYKRLNAKDENGQAKKILLILDNVWKKEDLEDVGIPLNDEKSLCRILLTSRSDLVCQDIAPESVFKIKDLSDEESLILFHQCIPKEPFYDQKMAKELVEESGRLPISIVAIAGAVGGRDKETWAKALTKLRKSTFVGEFAKVFKSLKLSYDFLEDERIKMFFRLFCFFRKGSDVPIEDLARYGMALGCFTYADKLYEARSDANSYAKELLHSSLLSSGGKEGCFKVHDIVWDFALSASSTDMFVVNHGDELIKSTTTKSFQNYTSISLQCNERVEVPKGVDFGNLKFLQLVGNPGSLPLKFPNNFYEHMHELNVLAFRSLNLTSLPKSLQLLKNLLSLSFDRCSIGGDISIIGNLVKLELLSFAHSDIQELPIQIANLKDLRLLDMTGCYRLRVIAPHVLSELTSLEDCIHVKFGCY